MTAYFYLFDVNDGQCAAINLPNGEWCIFDVGKSATFSPVNWIANRELRRQNPTTLLTGGYYMPSSFNFSKATISHHHGDHLGDINSLLNYEPKFLRSVQTDSDYINDVIASNTTSSLPAITTFLQMTNHFGPLISQPDYGIALITEMSIPVSISRSLGSDANSRVNNASIITRIDVYGNSILLCGDLEKEAWEIIINESGNSGRMWRELISNVTVIVSPHHGHSSGYSADLLRLARPSVVLTSVKTKDPHVDSGYSGDLVGGINLNGTVYKNITTRQKGHIRLAIAPSQALLGTGQRNWVFGQDALN